MKGKNMKTTYYKVNSRSSSHKGQIGKRVGSFMVEGEKYHTLRFDGQGFRSYPVRNLKEYFVPVFDTASLIAMMKKAEKMFSPKKEKVEKLKRFEDFEKQGGIYSDIIEKAFDYLAGETEKLKNK